MIMTATAIQDFYAILGAFGIGFDVANAAGVMVTTHIAANQVGREGGWEGEGEGCTGDPQNKSLKLTLTILRLLKHAVFGHPLQWPPRRLHLQRRWGLHWAFLAFCLLCFHWHGSRSGKFMCF